MIFVQSIRILEMGVGLDDFLHVITLTVFPKELDVFSLNEKIANDYALVLLS